MRILLLLASLFVVSVNPAFAQLAPYNAEGLTTGHFHMFVNDPEPIKKLLRAISLFQPFYLDDPQLLNVIEQLEHIPAHDTSRLFKLLIDAGVLFKRGARYRLSPDVLADYVIEAACVGPGPRSTGYAESDYIRDYADFLRDVKNRDA